MSCLLFWCCRGRHSNSDTEGDSNEQQSRDGDKIKKKKTWRERTRKGQQKKEQAVDIERAEDIQAAQQPAAGEKGSDVPHLPAGLGSGSLENISAGTPEKVRTALREEFQSTEDSPETSRDLTENLQDQIEAEAEAEAVQLLDKEEADNNHPLGDEMLEMMAMKGEAQVIKDLVLTDLQDLQTENLRDINFANTEAEAIKPQTQIDGDDLGTPNDQPLDAETDWLIDYEPIKSWGDFMEEAEETIHDTAVDQSKHQQGCGETKTESENAGTCEGAHDPQQRGAERKECSREKRHWTLEHLQKTLQAPPEEKSAPQTDCRKSREEAYGKRRIQPESAGTRERAPDTDPQQRGAQRKEYRREKRHWTVEHIQRTLQAPYQEKSAPRIICSQNREQAYGTKREQHENAGTCERAPDTDSQQRRAQRKEHRRETRHWAAKHHQKTLQAPPEVKSAPQRDCRKNAEGLRERTAEFRQKTHPRPADKQTYKGTYSFGRRIDEYGQRGAAQCCQREPRFQRRDAPQTPSQNGERVSKREMRVNPAQCTPERSARNDRTVRKPQWWLHDVRSAEPDERETREKHQKFRNGNRQWKSGRRTDASY
ncbi:hypothetical protein AOLI_G00270430 [Acnodon oligacanthus]